MREPVVSGRFYPEDPDELVTMINQCYAHRLGAENYRPRPAGKLVGFISPHAGYVFSGPVASWGYKRLSVETPLPKRILLLGPKHTPYGAAAALSAEDAWLTPLGSLFVDETLRNALENTGCFVLDDDAHRLEHSIEVQIPFLQHAMHDALPRIVPIALGFLRFEHCAALGKAIAEVLADHQFEDTACIISSDFSHETPREEAYRLDGEALDVITNLDAEAFYRMVIEEDRSICGVIPITVFLCALQGRNISAEKLAYATSMDIMKHPRGVGYASVIFEENS